MKRRIKWVTVSCLGVAALLGAAWWLTRGSEERSLVTTTVGDAATTSADGTARAKGAEPAAGIHSPAETPASGDLRVAPESIMRIRVRTAESGPIEGAEVSLTPLAVADHDTSASILDWAPIDRATLRATTTADGLAQLSIPIESEVVHGKLALWVTAPGYRAELRVLESIAAERALDAIELAPGTPTIVRVVASDGGELTNVALELRGAVETLGQELAPDVAAAQRLFHRTLSLPSADWQNSLSTAFSVSATASADGVLSSPRRAPFDGRIQFTVFPTFSVSGLVTSVDGFALSTRSKVHVGPVSPYEFDWVASANVRADGSFGPFDCPLRESPKYGFMLQAEEALGEVVYRDTPKRAQAVFVELTARNGINLAVLVRDHGGAPIAGAQVTTSWGGGVDAMDVYGAPKSTDANGVANVPAIPTGSISLSVGKSGYALTRVGPLFLTEEMERRVEITLEPGGTLEGRVLLNAKPVENFDITYWPGTALDQLSTETFSGRSDGRFSIDGVFARTQNVFASSASNPRSEIRSLPFIAGRAGPVDLELAESLSASGAVIDAETRRPIESARVHTWNAWLNFPIAQQGESVLSDERGHFELSGLRPGKNIVYVEADGYHWNQLQVQAGSGPTTDLGVVPMHRGIAVAFALKSDTPRDWTRYALETSIHAVMPTTKFGADGVLMVPDCLNGTVVFSVRYPDDTWATIRTSVHPGTAERIEHRVSSETELHLTIAPRGDCSSAPPIGGLLAYAQPDGLVVQRSFNLSGLDATIGDLPIGPALLSLHSGGHCLLRKHIVLGPARETQLEAATTCRERALRFLDLEGRPLVSAEIGIACAEAAPRALEWWTTDADGRIRISDPDCRSISITLSGEHSRNAWIVELRDEDEQTIRLDPDSTLLVRLLDGAQPISAVTVGAEEPTTSTTLVDRYSDAHGVARWDSLGVAEYVVSVHGQGLWSQSWRLGSRAPSEPPYDVQVRRVGALNFAVRGSLGEPIAGASLDLTSKEFGETLADWIESGRLPSDAPRRTDVNGVLLIGGIPHGAYEWTVTLADGRTQSGQAEVEPAATEAVDVVFLN